MVHELWETHDWKNSTEEQAIQALFNPPQHPDPKDMRDIDKFHSDAKYKYLNLFYGGNIPEPIKRVHDIS